MRDAGNRAPLRLFGRGNRVKTVRIDHLRAALLAVAAAGLLAAVGLLVVVLYAQPAEANFPGKPGKIAYAGKDAPNGDYEIYTINSGGGGKKQLTDNTLSDYEPAYSPSGKKIAYTGDEAYTGDAATGDYEIYTINAGGGGKLNVTNNSSDDYNPAYSPSGKQIAYSNYATGSDFGEIYTINPDGGSRQPVTNNSSDDYFPDYAPGGTRIAYTNYVTGGGEEIYTIKPNGGGRQPVTDNSSNDSWPSYSPSGKKIAYVNDAGGDREIWTIQPGGGSRQQVTDNATNDRDPSWGSQ
jgi:Tol biopolymer transport system component